MPPQQHRASDHNPNNLDLTRVATYERVIRAPLERVWENVLDWEHLPHLHASSFDYIAHDSAGEWGWRTWSDPGHNSHVELCVVDEERYVARSYTAGRQASEIWTTLEPRGEQTAISVEFYLTDVDPHRADSLGEMMLGLYSRLWDEDEAMMRERHRRLRESRPDRDSVNLGDREALLAQLENRETVLAQLGKREYQLRLHAGKLIAHATICPHLLGPLTDVPIEQGTLRCPWHGYEFDLESGECLSPAHANCKLPPGPTVEEVAGEIILRVG